MSVYRSAYEEYYRNINNESKGKNDIKKYSIFRKKSVSSDNSKYGFNFKNRDKIVEYLMKRIIKEVTGATIILIFFTGLKYIQTDQIKEMHTKCKQALNYNINYTDCVNTINEIKIGNIKGTDLKLEYIKTQAYKFMEYIKTSSTMQNQ